MMPRKMEVSSQCRLDAGKGCCVIFSMSVLELVCGASPLSRPSGFHVEKVPHVYMQIRLGEFLG